jgi:transcriptional regulator with XRE-family HTH domain
MPELKSEASRILGNRLRERRRQLSLNQEAVAHLAGLNVSNYARIDRGHGNPTFYTLIRLSTVLGIEPSELLAGFSSANLPPSRDSFTAADFRREQQARAEAESDTVQAGRAEPPTEPDTEPDTHPETQS